MSISTIFNELDIIRDGVVGPSTGALSSNRGAFDHSKTYNYVSESSILLAERKNAKEKQSAPILLASSRKVLPSSSSLDHISGTTVEAPTYWKSPGAGKKKGKAVKVGQTITKKKHAKHSKGENYADRLQTKHMKTESKKNKRSK